MSRRNRSRKHQVPKTTETEHVEETNEQPVVEEETSSPDVEDTQDDTAASDDYVVEEVSEEDQAREDYGLLDSWTNDDVRWWLSEANRDKIKSGDAFIADPTRKDRAVQDWSADELQAYVLGELSHVNPKRFDDIISEFRRRIQDEPAWTNRELVTYLRDGVEPPMTSNGVWVNDQTRIHRDVHEWSKEELEAWAAGEIDAKGKATPAKLSKALKEQVYIPGNYNDTDPSSVAKAYRDHVVDGISPVHATTDETIMAMKKNHITDTIDRYARAVKPGRAVSEKEGGAAQRELDALIHYILRMDGQQLAAGLEEFKKCVSQHADTVFAPSYAHRFVHMIKGDRARREFHVNFIELMVIVATKPKVARRQVDIRHMLKSVRADMQDRLVDYFTNYA